MDYRNLEDGEPWWIFEVDNMIFTGKSKEPEFNSNGSYGYLTDVFIQTDKDIYKSPVTERYLYKKAFSATNKEDWSINITEPS